MKSFGIFAASSLFGALVNAAPLNKRDLVWVTKTDVAVVTVPVTMTVWVPFQNDDRFARQSFTRDVVSTVSSVVVSASTSTSVYVEPSATSTSAITSNSSALASTSTIASNTSTITITSSSTSTSVYVAPTTSTSEYVAPTTTSTSVYVAPTTTSTSVYIAPTTTSSTSVYVAPTTSTSVYVAPTTSSTSVYVAPTTTSTSTSVYIAPSTTSSSAAAAATTTAASSGSGVAAAGTTYTGDLTWYDVGLGSCGITSTSSEAIVAVSHTIMDDPQYYTANPNNNPLCGRKVSITGVDGTKYTASVVDRCEGCAKADLDLSADFFNLVTKNGDGRVHNIAWSWL